jgi:hypothetical protein
MRGAKTSLDVDKAADVATAARLSTRFAPQPLEWKVREDSGIGWG